MINDAELRRQLSLLLVTKTRNQIVQEIKEGQKTTFHQYNIDKFLNEKDVALSTIKKIEKYILNNR